ncbi:winged helix-turn-helix domain-containing protein [Maricaulis alexandrii]|uniref:winged helix-turn-helix domain-containing protein n=1 Tax=Maricaulis alexandrii TaxID=2570354 RepID=UPI0011099D8D|nr:winged helix-turn-helix domain-containing protein [Maricaulis alexandrii]
MSDRLPIASHTAVTSCVRVGQAVCELKSGRVWREGREDRLEPRLSGVLALLTQRAPDVISRDEFLDLVWDGEGSDEALTQSISRLRRLLGDAGAIKTHPRIGYSLAVAIEPLESVSSVMKNKPDSAIRFVRRNPWRLAVAAVLLVAVALAAIRLLFPPMEREIEFIVQDSEGGEVEFEVQRDGN